MTRRTSYVIGFLLASLFAIGTSSARADCLDDAANWWSVPPAVARAIAQQESGMNPSVVSQNHDGSQDIGLMQINSSWLPKLAQYGITAETLRKNACVNAYVGNWILAQNIQRLGYNWDAIGAYNSPTPANRYRYALAIYRRLMSAQAAKSLPLDH